MSTCNNMSYVTSLSVLVSVSSLCDSPLFEVMYCLFKLDGNVCKSLLSAICHWMSLTERCDVVIYLSHCVDRSLSLFFTVQYNVVSLCLFFPVQYNVVSPSSIRDELASAEHLPRPLCCCCYSRRGSSAE